MADLPAALEPEDERVQRGNDRSIAPPSSRRQRGGSPWSRHDRWSSRGSGPRAIRVATSVAMTIPARAPANAAPHNACQSSGRLRLTQSPRDVRPSMTVGRTARWQSAPITSPLNPPTTVHAGEQGRPIATTIASRIAVTRGAIPAPSDGIRPVPAAHSTAVTPNGPRQRPTSPPPTTTTLRPARIRSAAPARRRVVTRASSGPQANSQSAATRTTAYVVARKE